MGNISSYFGKDNVRRYTYTEFKRIGLRKNYGSLEYQDYYLMVFIANYEGNDPIYYTFNNGLSPGVSVVRRRGYGMKMECESFDEYDMEEYRKFIDGYNRMTESWAV